MDGGRDGRTLSGGHICGCVIKTHKYGRKKKESVPIRMAVIPLVIITITTKTVIITIITTTTTIVIMTIILL